MNLRIIVAESCDLPMGGANQLVGVRPTSVKAEELQGN